MEIAKWFSSMVVAAFLAVTPVGDSNIEKTVEELPQEVQQVEVEIKKEVPQKRTTVHRDIVDLPDIENSFKTFMDYRAITDTSSKQWKMQQGAYTDENGLRKIDGYYCVAMGSGISGKISTKFIITLESGEKFKAILADQKADIHTDDTNKYRPMDSGRGNIIEFIVDYDCLPEMVSTMGDVSYTPNGIFRGEIIEIEVINS